MKAVVNSTVNITGQVAPVDAKVVAISTFAGLAKAADGRLEDGCFNKYMCVSTPNKKVYIGFSYVLSESAVLCEIHDIFPNLNRSEVVTYAFVIDYIQNIDTISNIHVGVHNGNS